MIARRWAALLRAAVLLVLVQFVAASAIAGPNGFDFDEDDGDDQHVEAKLIADHSTVAPGRTFRIGVQYTIDPHWHIYWRNPGDAGTPTDFSIKKDPLLTVGPLMWPAPIRFETPGPIINFGYEERVLLWRDVTLSAEAKPGSELKLEGASDWLMCKELCIPGETTIELTLKVGSEPAKSDAWDQFEAARAATPTSHEVAAWDGSIEPLKLTAKVEGSTVSVAGDVPVGYDPASVHLYPWPGSPIEAARPKSVTSGATQFSFDLPIKRLKGAKGKEPAPIVTIVVPGLGDKPALSYDVTLPALPGAEASASKSSVGSPTAPSKGGSLGSADIAAPSKGLFGLLLLGFLGGLILNVMPCVLPVISLKILGLVKQSGQSSTSIFRHGMVFTLGIWASFMALAIPLFVVRLQGKQAGWGEIFQYPDFNLGLLILLVVFGHSLLGIFEVATPTALAGKIQGVAKKKGYWGSFGNGILATVLATPCMAPFLAGAMGYALSAEPVVIPIFFTSVALGLASPYILLSLNPAWTKFLPKPGEWMDKLKSLMGLAMISAAIFPFNTLSLNALNIDGEGARIDKFPTYLLLFVTSLSLGTIIVGQWTGPLMSSGRRWLLRLLAVGIAVWTYWMFLAEPMYHLRTGTAPDQIDWVKFTPETLDEHLSSGQTVFMDFTAAWCTTCQFNEGNAIDTQSVRAALKDHGIVAMKADWTRKDPDIGAMLARYKRPGVPFYIIFPQGKTDNPIILPELLTEGTVLEALERAG